jgi:hypothetical protein
MPPFFIIARHFCAIWTRSLNMRFSDLLLDLIDEP